MSHQRDKRYDAKDRPKIIQLVTPPKIKYEDTPKFKAFDYMMRSNRGIRGPV